MTEADIAGGRSRTTPASLLVECWIQASKELGVRFVHNRAAKSEEDFEEQFVSSASKAERGTILAAESSLNVSLKIANQILRERSGNGWSVIIVTGSLHIVSMVLAALNS